MLLLYTSEDISEKMKANRLGGVKSFLGLLIIGGAIKKSVQELSSLYSERDGIPVYRHNVHGAFLLLKRFL